VFCQRARPTAKEQRALRKGRASTIRAFKLREQTRALSLHAPATRPRETGSRRGRMAGWQREDIGIRRRGSVRACPTPLPNPSESAGDDNGDDEAAVPSRPVPSRTIRSSALIAHLFHSSSAAAPRCCYGSCRCCCCSQAAAGSVRQTRAGEKARRDEAAAAVRDRSSGEPPPTCCLISRPVVELLNWKNRGEVSVPAATLSLT
jgi:hypothetical protein